MLRIFRRSLLYLAGSHHVLKTETVHISETSPTQPTYTQCNHRQDLHYRWADTKTLHFFTNHDVSNFFAVSSAVLYHNKDADRGRGGTWWFSSTPTPQVLANITVNMRMSDQNSNTSSSYKTVTNMKVRGLCRKESLPRISRCSWRQDIL